MWQEKNNALYKKYEFKDFQEAFSFIQKVADLAEKEQHHPKWTNEWNKVEIWLSTHEADNKVTAKDKNMADAIDKLENRSEPDAEVRLFADGGSRGNPGPAASGYVILDADDHIMASRGVYLGETTNNQAEYQALKLGLEEAKKMQVKRVSVFMDSQLVINQLNGLYKQKNVDLRPIYEAIKELSGYFESITFAHVPREKNTLADAEVNKALDAEALK